MLDLLFVVVMLGLFGLTVLVVNVCDRLIGPDEELLEAAPTKAAPDPGPERLVA